MLNESDIGYRVFVARKEKGLKQIEMSRKLNMSQSSYSDIETGKKQMSVKQLCDIAKSLGVPASYLLGEKDDDLTPEEELELINYKKYIIGKRK